MGSVFSHNQEIITLHDSAKAYVWSKNEDNNKYQPTQLRDNGSLGNISEVFSHNEEIITLHDSGKTYIWTKNKQGEYQSTLLQPNNDDEAFTDIQDIITYHEKLFTLYKGDLIRIW